MGNHSNKLERKFSSLSDQDLANPYSPHEPQFLRKIAKAARKRQKENGKKENGGLPAQFLDALFKPEYPSEALLTEVDFNLAEIIAHGAYGHVLKVERLDNGKTYAMKVMNKQKLIVDAAVQQCRDEATIQHAVGHHPFIVKPFYFFQNRENVYIVMQYVSRGELFSAWKHHGYFSEALVRLYIAELAMVLDFLHQSGIMYRDLKMENILIDLEGHLKVIDFGLAKWLQKGARTKTICGTLQYIAPEILDILPYGHAADWWSLGILMYALLVGEYPVSAKDCRNHFEMADKARDHVYELPPQCSGFSWEARECVRNLLVKDPSMRVHDLRTLQRQPFFRNLDFDSLLQKQIQPNMYLESQESYGFGFDRDNSTYHGELDDAISRATSIDGGLDDSRFFSQFDFTSSAVLSWNDTVASMDASFV